MNENTLKSQIVKGLTFKGRFKGRRTSFMPKVVSRKVVVTDAFESRYKTSLSVFIPKLSPRYVKPQTMLHIVNGASSCLVRAKDPSDLIQALEELITALRSDKWQDAWWRTCDISEEIITNNKLNLDEEIVDINAWQQALEDTINIELVQIKQDENGNDV